MKKKTLVLTENFPPMSGGSGRWFWELYSRLPTDEYLVVADDIAGAFEFDKSHNINVIRMPLSCSEWGFKSLLGLNFYFHSVRQLIKIIKDENITHIHTGRVIHEGVIAWLLSFLTKTTYITFVHGEDVETAATSREHNLMVKQVCKKAQAIICNSHNSANIVKRLSYASDNKITVLHPGFDEQKFFPAKHDPLFKEKMGWVDKKIILTVGRLQERKGQDKMIEAMPALLKQNPNTLYVIVGRGECKENLECLVERLFLQNNVQFLDEISDEEMIKCYQQCDLFILPNRTIDNDIEGFGMVLVEAQACGKAVVAGDSGGTKETMDIGNSGLVIDCSKSEIISAALNDLFSNESRLQKMGLEGETFVNTHFTWDTHLIKAKKTFAQFNV